MTTNYIDHAHKLSQCGVVDLYAFLEGSMEIAVGAYLLLMQVCAKLLCNSTGAALVGGVKW
jgi:hypothetical protein